MYIKNKIKIVHSHQVHYYTYMYMQNKTNNYPSTILLTSSTWQVQWTLAITNSWICYVVLSKLYQGYKSNEIQRKFELCWPGRLLCRNDRVIHVGNTLNESPLNMQKNALLSPDKTNRSVTSNFFFCISAFSCPYFGRAWWKTSTHQIWHELVHGGPRYGRMNT